MFSYSGIREEADGSMTYCLMGNGLTILADEEYLTISSTLEPHFPPSTTSSRATHTPATTSVARGRTSYTPPTLSSDRPNSMSMVPSFSYHGLGLMAHISGTAVLPPSLSSDTLTTCSLAHPSQPLTTQPPKAQHHLIQQTLLPSRSVTISHSSRSPVPPPHPPPPPPITTQVTSSSPSCCPNPTAPTLHPSQPAPAAHGHAHSREESEKKKEYKDDDDDDDEEDPRQVCCDLLYIHGFIKGQIRDIFDQMSIIFFVPSIIRHN